LEGAPALPSEWFEKHRFTLVIILGLAILILQIVQLLEGRGPDFTGTAAGADDRSARLVYISGAVVDPGVYEVQPGDRIQDVLAAAGGPSADADLTRLNLAAYLADGQQIHVPIAGEPSRNGQALDINLANLDELEGLPGIGPVTAEKIVNHRRINGPFLSADDLLAAGLTRTQVAAIEEFILFR
jgi:competence protein ComEA